MDNIYHFLLFAALIVLPVAIVHDIVAYYIKGYKRRLCVVPKEFNLYNVIFCESVFIWFKFFVITIYSWF